MIITKEHIHNQTVHLQQKIGFCIVFSKSCPNGHVCRHCFCVPLFTFKFDEYK